MQGKGSFTEFYRSFRNVISGLIEPPGVFQARVLRGRRFGELMSLEEAATEKGVGLIEGRVDLMQTTERRTYGTLLRSLPALTL